MKPQRVLNQKVNQELCSKVTDFSEKEKCLVILMNEKKIEGNLVWDKHTG